MVVVTVDATMNIVEVVEEVEGQVSVIMEMTLSAREVVKSKF